MDEERHKLSGVIWRKDGTSFRTLTFHIELISHVQFHVHAARVSRTVIVMYHGRTHFLFATSCCWVLLHVKFTVLLVGECTKEDTVDPGNAGCEYTWILKKNFVVFSRSGIAQWVERSSVAR